MRWLICLFFGITSLEGVTVRVGHFPNITHAQGLLGHAESRSGGGLFEKALGPENSINWFVYNAGPSAMEGFFTESLDLAYVGPSPAINAYVVSHGQEVRIISGSCNGGAALVVQNNEEIKVPKDFKDKKIATPQLGNTQDVALRSWLKDQGFHVTLSGGDVTVIPMLNASQLVLFKLKQIDGAFTVEPWVSRLILEAGGRVFLEESSLWESTGGKYATTLLVARKQFIEDHPDIVAKWVRAHVEATDWIKENPEEALTIIRKEINEEIKQSLPDEVVTRAWKNIDVTYDPIPASIVESADDAYRIGFLNVKPNLESIFSLSFLNDVLREKNLNVIEWKK